MLRSWYECLTMSGKRGGRWVLRSWYEYLTMSGKRRVGAPLMVRVPHHEREGRMSGKTWCARSEQGGRSAPLGAGLAKEAGDFGYVGDVDEGVGGVRGDVVAGGRWRDRFAEVGGHGCDV